jgi:hypothetical protein
LTADERFVRRRRLGARGKAMLRVTHAHLRSNSASEIGIDQDELRADRLVEAPLSEHFKDLLAGPVFRAVALEPFDDIVDVTLHFVVMTWDFAHTFRKRSRVGF